MIVKLEQLIDDEWYLYGVYNLEKDWDLAAFTRACAEIGKFKEIRAVRF